MISDTNIVFLLIAVTAALMASNKLRFDIIALLVVLVLMLQAGVDVYEMKYQGGMQHEVDTPPIESGFVSLHAKAAVLDREHVFIGSFNFSPRLRNLNTEMGILVHSEEFGEQVAAVMDRAMAADNAWMSRAISPGSQQKEHLRANLPRISGGGSRTVYSGHSQ